MLYVLRRNESAIEPVPNGQLIAPVTTPVRWVGTVMQLMVRWADEPRVEFGAVVHPYMPMAQMVNEVENPYNRMEAHVGEKGDVAGKPLVGSPCDQARKKCRYPGHDHLVDGVHPKCGNWGKHLRRVVHFVKLPQPWHIMQQAVGDKTTKIVGDEKEDGKNQLSYPAAGFSGC